MGLSFAPLGALLPELFPTEVRYTGAASAYNLGGILGASLAPSLAQILEANGGIAWVGYYIAVAAAISFFAILSMRETRHAAAPDAHSPSRDGRPFGRPMGGEGEKKAPATRLPRRSRRPFRREPRRRPP